MRAFTLLLLISAPLAAPAAPPAAQTSAMQSATTGQDPIVVTGEDRLVCRRVVRTATRMRSGRVCRTMAQWRRETGVNIVANEANATVDGAADSLEMAGEKVSTNCAGGMGAGHDTRLGPR